MTAEEEYRVVYVPWFAVDGRTGSEQEATFISLTSITDWIDRCRSRSIRLTIHTLEKCEIHRTAWEALDTERLYLQTRTGQFGIPTQEVVINLMKRKK